MGRYLRFALSIALGFGTPLLMVCTGAVELDGAVLIAISIMGSVWINYSLKEMGI